MSQEFQTERKLTAVLSADVEGFSRLIEADEVGTLQNLASQRRILDDLIARYRGRVVNTTGDSVLAEFPSVADAVQCAVETQKAHVEAAERLPAEKRVLFRILARQPNHVVALRMTMISFVGLHQMEEAHQAMARLRALEPDVTISSLLELIPFQHMPDREFYTDTMRKAGLPE